MKRLSARQSGFTLLEVLIAAVLIGSVFVAVVSLMSQSLRNIERMKPHELAMLRAREIMNQQLLRDEMKPESTSGAYPDGSRWYLEIAPLDFVAMGRSAATPQPVDPSVPSATQQPTPGTKTLFRVRVQVAWGERSNARTYDLQTMQWAMWTRPQS